MDGRSNRTYALITGGSSGIGLALAHEFASRGHDIAIVALPNSGQKEAIKELSEAHQCKVKSLEINLTDASAIKEISEWIDAEDMTIQALVNNAGLGYADNFSDLNAGFISTLLDVNIKATTLLTHSLISKLAKHPNSYILNMSSAAAFYSMPYKSAYAASKKYILDFSLALREELKHKNIGVTAVCPAGVLTSDAIRERIKDAGWMAKKSALEPEQVAKEALNAMLKNKGYIVPGKLASLMAKARFIVPSSIQRKLIAQNFKKA